MSGQGGSEQQNMRGERQTKQRRGRGKERAGTLSLGMIGGGGGDKTLARNSFEIPGGVRRWEKRSVKERIERRGEKVEGKRKEKGKKQKNKKEERRTFKNIDECILQLFRKTHASCQLHLLRKVSENEQMREREGEKQKKATLMNLSN